MFRSPSSWTMIFVVAYLLCWTFLGAGFFQVGSNDSLFLLALLTLPSSLLVHGARELMGIHDLRFDLIGFLVVGGLQYGVIGYAFGLLVQRLLRRRSGGAPSA